MTNTEIKEYIDLLNKGNFEERIFLRKISETVEIAKVWDREQTLNNDCNTNLFSYRFFFIKNADNKYVGAVLDMYKDLHWYICEKERKKGHLTKSLRESILPYLFYDDRYPRKSQRITIGFEMGETNYINSKRVAERLGFKPADEQETVFFLKKNEFVWVYENLTEVNGVMTKERFENLQQRLLIPCRQLNKISDELIMTYDDDGELAEIVKKLSFFPAKMEDIIKRVNKE